MIQQLFIETEAPKPGQLALYRISRRAMATEFDIAIPYGTPHAVEAGEAALDDIDRIEELLTVYSDTSDVSRLNRDGGGAVTAELMTMLQHCAALTLDTAGAFDVAIGTVVKCWGFHRRRGRVPTEGELGTAMHAGGMRHVLLDERTQRLKFLRAVELNFGAIGKGYALDCAAAILRDRWGIRSALLHGGGSSVRAIGVPPTDGRGWRVRVGHPSSANHHLGAVYLRDEGFGTSAATYQHFEHAGKTYGHVLDPRTGRPAAVAESASCTAATAMSADALSTAFFVAGEAWTAAYCRTHPDVGAVLLPVGCDIAAKPAVFNLHALKYDNAGTSPPTFHLHDD